MCHPQIAAIDCNKTIYLQRHQNGYCRSQQIRCVITVAPNMERTVNTRKFDSRLTEPEKIAFSIEEILKPSFGVKKIINMTSNSAEPLDMRKERNNVFSEYDILGTEFNCSISPLQSTSADELSCCSFTSSTGSSTHVEDTKHNNNNTIYEQYEFDDRFKHECESTHDFAPNVESLYGQDELSYLTSNSYFAILNQIYSFGAAARENNHYSFQSMRHLLNPYTAYSNLSSNLKRVSKSADIGKDLNIFSKNVNSDILKTTDSRIPSEDIAIANNTRTGSARSASSIRMSNNTGCSRSPQEHRGSNEEDNKCSSRIKTLKTDSSNGIKSKDNKDQFLWPAWVYCTRYSDRPSSGPRYRKPRARTNIENDKRPRTAFSTQQLTRLRHEFETCPYLSETRRQALATELGLNESQVKIWFQNKRAKLKKSSGSKNVLALRLMQEGLYNHSTIVVDGDDAIADNNNDTFTR